MFECNEPCLFTIFGSTGDLSYKKIFPALFHLHASHRLPKCFFIIAIGRKKYLKNSFLEQLKPFIAKNELFTEEKWISFSHIIDYFQLDFNNEIDYLHFYDYINELDAAYKTLGNRIFYFAVSPNFFEIISLNLNNYNLISSNNGFHRVVFEKPFGKDLKTAQKFNKVLQTYFSENQIYRIDHYLGKEMIRNILVLRFTNRLFEEIWCKNGIEKVHIKILETIGIENRGEYYDNTGALRDMVQNHLLQMLALVAMDPPAKFDTSSIKDKKVNVLKHLKLYEGNLISPNIILGQYDNYKETPGVRKDSLTETYAFVPCEIDSARWRGVPFILETGKSLDQKKAEIEIYFKPSSSNYLLEHQEIKQNKLVIRIQPSEGINLEMNAKKPGIEFDIDTVNMEYCHSCNSLSRSSDAYEKLIVDLINGDSTRFTRWDEIEFAWNFIDQLTDKYSLNKDNLKLYKSNSRGPKNDANF